MEIKWNHTPQDARIVATAQICSRNGGFGCAWITRQGVNPGDGFRLKAASETTGRAWRSPDETFATVKEAKVEANRRWRPA